jgi:hypothetical protein
MRHVHTRAEETVEDVTGGLPERLDDNQGRAMIRGRDEPVPCRSIPASRQTTPNFTVPVGRRPPVTATSAPVRTTT